ncbi:MAG: DegV family protein [Candidatus Heimdallarchaeaceae archaeon]|jgi:fatty acid-binding protein DegV
MNTAIVIDTSREIPNQWYSLYNIYPVGYVIEDSNGQRHIERTQIQTVRTPELVKLVSEDRNSALLAPSIKDFVELYTYLSENFEAIVSLHSSNITPAVFENALVAKKLVSEVDIDIIDSHTFGASSGIFVEELAKFIMEAKNINEIRKEAISLNKHISSIILSKNDQLNTIGLRKGTWHTAFTSTFRPYVLYQESYGKWETVKRGRNIKSFVNEIIKRVEIVNRAKEIKTAYITHHGALSRNVRRIKDIVSNTSIVETNPSLVTHYLLGKNYIDFAFL